MHAKSIIRFGFCVFITFCIFSCKNEELINENFDSMVVEVKEAKKEIFDDSLNNFGTITYKSKTDLTSQTGGRITGLKITEGSYVKKGDVIAVLENVQLEIKKIEAEISLESAESALEAKRSRLNDERLSIESRMLNLEKTDLSIKQKEMELETNKNNLEDSITLHKMGGITDAELEKMKLSVASQQTDIALLKKEKEISLLGLRDIDLIKNGICPSEDEEEKKEQFFLLNLQSYMAELRSMEASVKNARQELDAINKMIDELTIRSPITGYVASKYYENNEYIRENEKLATIIDTDTVYALFYVQEQDMVNFSLGTKLVLNLPSLNKSVNGKIDEISAIADLASGNFAVKALLDNPKGLIKPGMFVRCSIQKGEKSYYICLPETCLASTDERKRQVYCIFQGKAVLHDIEVLACRNGKIWIKDGLKEGQLVIDRPSPFLKEGQNVVSK